MSLETGWKIVVNLWALITFVAAAAFFFGGEWSKWQKISGEYENFAKLSDIDEIKKNFDNTIKSGDPVSLEVQTNLFLYGNPNSGNAGTSVILSGTDQSWTISKK